MVLENTGSEASTTAIHELGNQTDFRRQHQDVTTRRQLLRGQLQIDLGLAGSRDPPQQKATTGGQGGKLIHHILLFLREGTGRLQLSRS